jgi:hypothetical protein
VAFSTISENKKGIGIVDKIPSNVKSNKIIKVEFLAFVKE